MNEDDRKHKTCAVEGCDKLVTGGRNTRHCEEHFKGKSRASGSNRPRIRLLCTVEQFEALWNRLGQPKIEVVLLKAEERDRVFDDETPDTK